MDDWLDDSCYISNYEKKEINIETQNKKDDKNHETDINKVFDQIGQGYEEYKTVKKENQVDIKKQNTTEIKSVDKIINDNKKNNKQKQIINNTNKKLQIKNTNNKKKQNINDDDYDDYDDQYDSYYDKN